MARRKSFPQRDEVLGYINDKYGSDKIFKLPQKSAKYTPDNFVSFGLYTLNEMITGDYQCGPPRKKIVEFYGPEGVGKTSLALSVSKEVANKKQKVLYCDVEHGLNEYYAKQMNINPDYFYYFQPESGEEAFTISEDLLKKFNFDLFVLDSVGGIIPRAMLEGRYDEAQMGSTARLMSKACKRLSPLLSRRNTASIFINQLSSKIGGYGLKEETAGGRKLKYYLWVRLEIRAPRKGKVIEKVSKGKIGDFIEVPEKKEKKKKGIGQEVGIKVNVKSVKNKLFCPYRTCQLQIIYGKGFDKQFDFLTYLDAKEIISWGNKRLKYKNKSYEVKTFIEKYQKDKEFKKRIQDEIKEKKDVTVVFGKGDKTEDE